MQPDDEDMDDDVRELLTGIIVEVRDHKTGIQGPAEVWLAQQDEILCRAYSDITERLAVQLGKSFFQS